MPHYANPRSDSLPNVAFYHSDAQINSKMYSSWRRYWYCIRCRVKLSFLKCRTCVSENHLKFTTGPCSTQTNDIRFYGPTSQAHNLELISIGRSPAVKLSQLYYKLSWKPEVLYSIWIKFYHYLKFSAVSGMLLLSIKTFHLYWLYSENWLVHKTS